MKRIVVLLALFSLISATAYAAGSFYPTIEQSGSSIRLLQIPWTVDASGDLNSVSMYFKGGVIMGFMYDNEAGVTDAYDVTLEAEWKIATSASTTRTIEWADVLDGKGANLSNSTDGDVLELDALTFLPACKLTPVIANAGNATSGTLIIYYWVK